MRDWRILVAASLFVAVYIGAHGLAAVETDTPTEVEACDPGPTGGLVEYRGTVRNSDYRFSATIPNGLTGWGGVGNSPFHGFTIYLDGKPQPSSCIHFTIAIHVPLEADSPQKRPMRRQALPKSKRVRVGNRIGALVSTTGTSHGISIENIGVSLRLRRAGYDVDVAIRLVTPTRGKEDAERVFHEFLSQMRFW